MFRNRVLLASVLAALSAVPAQVQVIQAREHIEVVKERRDSRNKTRALNYFGRTFPRSRKTTTAARLKRAATKRRNIQKRK
jgi:hypothetical protein